MSNAGDSQRKIAKLLRISRCGVQKCLQRYRFHQSVDDRPRCGAPRKLSARTERKLVVCSKSTPSLTARQIQAEVPQSSCVCLGTVKRILRHNGLFGRIAAATPFLSKRNIKQRRSWCLKRRTWNAIDWSKIIFSDETRLELMSKSRQFVRRRQGERFRQKYTKPTVKFGKSLMLWGAIRYDGKRVLVRCDESVDSVEYQRLLLIGLPAIYNSRYIFQHDGAPAHRSISTRTFLEARAVRLLDCWPAQSPDINIIENLWQILKAKVKERHPVTVEDMWRIAQEEWELIPANTIVNLYNSLPRRVVAVLKARGGPTKY